MEIETDIWPFPTHRAHKQGEKEECGSGLAEVSDSGDQGGVHLHNGNRERCVSGSHEILWVTF